MVDHFFAVAVELELMQHAVLFAALDLGDQHPFHIAVCHPFSAVPMTVFLTVSQSCSGIVVVLIADQAAQFACLVIGIGIRDIKDRVSQIIASAVVVRRPEEVLHRLFLQHACGVIRIGALVRRSGLLHACFVCLDLRGKGKRIAVSVPALADCSGLRLHS